MRALDRGEELIVTSNGRPVGELRPVGRRGFVSSAALQAALRGAGEIDPKQFFEDVDAFVDQDPIPRPWPDE